MSESEMRPQFYVRWDGTQYRVSIPNYPGGEVVSAALYARAEAQLAAKDAVIRRLFKAIDIALNQLPEWTVKVEAIRKKVALSLAADATREGR